MGRRSKKSNDVDTPEKLGNVGVKRDPRNETDRSAKKQKLATVVTNHGMSSMMASIPKKKLPTATSLDENSTPISKKEGAEANQSANKEDEASVDKSRSSKTLFVANLSSPIPKDQIMKFFKDAGEIVDVRFTKQFRGFCYVEFIDEVTAQKALKKNGEKLMGCDIVVSNETEHKSICNRGMLFIIVKGLDRSQPLEEIQKSLKEYFGLCGEITYVLTPVKHSVPKGFAFLGFKDEDAVSKALELNNTKLGDCILTVQKGVNRDSSGDGGCFDDGKRDGFGGGDDFDSGRPDDIGGGGALDSSSDFGSRRNRGFGGCTGCDSIFCHGGSFGGGNGFNSGNGFIGESGFSGGKSGEFGGREAHRGDASHSVGNQGRRGGRSHSGGGQGRGVGQSHSGDGQGRGCGRSHSGGQAQDGGQGRVGGPGRRGGRALNGSRGRGSGRGHGGSRGRH